MVASAPVQIVAQNITGTNGSRSYAVTAPSQAGDTLLATVSGNNSTAQLVVTQLSDTKGNIWILDNTFAASPGTYAYRCPGATGGAGGGPTAALTTSDSLRVTMSTTLSAGVGVCAIAVTGLGAIDGTPQFAGPSAVLQVGVPITPSQVGDTLIGICSAQNAAVTLTVDSPFTSGGQVTTQGLQIPVYDLSAGAAGTPVTCTVHGTASATMRLALWAFLPTTIPAGTVIQSTTPVHVRSLVGPANLTLPAPTSPGNTVVVCASSNGTAGNPQVSGITLGGSADNFALAGKLNSATRNDSEIWADRNAASGQTAIAVTFAGGSGTGDLYAEAYEVAGSIFPDQVKTNEGGPGTTWTSGASAAMSQAAEILFGNIITTGSVVATVTGVGTWTTQSSGSVNTYAQVSGFQNVSSGGTATFSGTQPSGQFTVVEVTFSIGVGMAYGVSNSAPLMAATGSASITGAVSGTSVTQSVMTGAASIIPSATPISGLSSTISSTSGSASLIAAVSGSAVAHSAAFGSLISTSIVAGLSVTISVTSGALAGTIPVSGLAVAVSVATGSARVTFLGVSGLADATLTQSFIGSLIQKFAVSGVAVVTNMAMNGTFIVPTLPALPIAGSLDPVTAEWLDSSMVSHGLIPFSYLTATLYYNQVSSWQMTVPYSDAMWAMVQSGDFVVHVNWKGLFQFGGKCEMPGYSNSLPGSGASTQPGELITLAGADYLALIANRSIYQLPAVAWSAQGGGGIHDLLSGPCETVIKHFVTNNASSATPLAARRIPFLDVAPDLARGGSVFYLSTYQQGVSSNLLDVIRTMIDTGGPMGVSVSRVGSRLAFDTYIPRDLTQSAWFSQSLGNLTSVAMTISDATVTDALVQGQSTYYEASTGAGPWAKVEDYVDQTSETNATVIQQAGAGALGGGAAGPAVAVTATDIPFLTFGRDYHLGDKVTVEVRPGVTYQDVISSVVLTLDPTASPSEVIVPTIGYAANPGSADAGFVPQLAARVAYIEARLRAGGR